MFPIRLRLFLLAGLMSAAATAGAHDRYHDGGWRGAEYRFRCESQDSRTAYCRVDTRYGVRLVDRLSRASCIPGRTWGWDRGGVWVTDGCRAEFATAGGRYRDRDSRWRRDWDDDDDDYRDDRVDYGGYGGYGGYGSYGRGNGYVITCESRDGVYNFCRGGRGIREVRVQRQLSTAACRYNDSWGFRGDGIWVDRGCRAEFAVY